MIQTVRMNELFSPVELALQILYTIAFPTCKAPAERVQHFINIIQHLLHIVACCLIVFNRRVAKRMQRFVQHDTTFLQKYIQ